MHGIQFQLVRHLQNDEKVLRSQTKRRGSLRATTYLRQLSPNLIMQLRSTPQSPPIPARHPAKQLAALIFLGWTEREERLIFLFGQEAFAGRERWDGSGCFPNGYAVRLRV